MTALGRAAASSLASFAAAFMSTQATQMNWGSSYLINDLYRRFVKKDASERHYVLASRIATGFVLTSAANAAAMRLYESVGGVRPASEGRK